MKIINKYGLLFSWGLIIITDLLFRGTDWIQQNFTGLHFLGNFVLSSLALLSFLYIISYISKKWILISLFILFVIFPQLLNGNYFIVYKKFISPAIFRLFCESTKMVTTTGADNVSYFYIFFLIIFSIGAIFFLIKFKPKRKWLIIPNFILSLSAFIFLLIHWFSVDFFQQSSFAFYNNMAQSIIEANNVNYNYTKVKLSPFTNIKEKKPNFVFIIGESQVLQHMQIYGYNKKTTPNLKKLYDQKKIIPFTKVISVGNKTRLSVPYMLTGLMGPDPNGVIYQYPTIFDYAKNAGYTTIFISAQDLRWGNIYKMFNNKNLDIILDGNNFSASVDVHKGIDDLIILPKIFDVLKNCKPPFLLVLQMDGSHYPYNIHSPDSLKKFLPEDSPNCINAYDNTLVVTDLYLSRLYKLISAKYSDTYMFFSPDHGQNLGGQNGYFNDNYSNLVINNALIVFPPVNDTSRYNIFNKNKNRLSSQADIFATILDLINIKPQYKIDGISLLSKPTKKRLIICSEYMPTFHNNPHCAIVDTNLQTKLIFFDKKSVTDNTNNTYYSYDKLPEFIKKSLKKRLNRKIPEKL